MDRTRADILAAARQAEERVSAYQAVREANNDPESNDEGENS